MGWFRMVLGGDHQFNVPRQSIYSVSSPVGRRRQPELLHSLSHAATIVQCYPSNIPNQFRSTILAVLSALGTVGSRRVFINPE